MHVNIKLLERKPIKNNLGDPPSDHELCGIVWVDFCDGVVEYRIIENKSIVDGQICKLIAFVVQLVKLKVKQER